MPYALQWGGGVLTLPVAALAHGFWGGNAATLPWVAIAMTLAGAALAFATFKITAAKKVLQIHATLSVAVGMLWLTAATIAGPIEHPLIDVWLLGMPVVAGSWSVRRLVGRGQKTSDGEGGDAKILSAVKLAGAKVRGEIEVGPNRASIPLQLPPGKLSADDVSSAKTRLASALSVGTSSVRVAADPDHHDRATVTVVPHDMLKALMPWPGPSAPGGSIAEPLNVGIYGDGVHTNLWLPGDPDVNRNATHLIVMGMNGSGKSYGAKEAWTEILTRRDVKLWLADGFKGMQTIGAFAPYVDWAVPSTSGAQTMLSVLPDVIQARANALAEEGLDQWVPGCKLKYLVVWIEEAVRVIREADEIADLVNNGRSAGVTIVLSLQRPSFTQIPVDVRNAMGAVWCFGVKETADAAFALDDALLDAGADPAAWKNRKPGYSYLEAPGIDEERMVEPARTWKTNGDQELVAAIIDAGCYDDEIDAATAIAAGKTYANRVRYTTDESGKPVAVTAGNSAKSLVNRTDTAPSATANEHSDRAEAVELLAQAAELIVSSQFGSTSMLQRKLRVSHNDANALMRELEERMVVGPQPEDLDKARPVLIEADELDDVLAGIRDDHDSEEDTPPRPAKTGIHGRYTAADETDEAMQLPDNPDPELDDFDEDTELPPVKPSEDFELPEGKPTPEEARAALAARLAEIRATGATTVRPKDIGKTFFETVRVRSWVSGQLAQLALTGELIPSDREGVYLFPGAVEAA